MNITNFQCYDLTDGRKQLILTATGTHGEINPLVAVFCDYLRADAVNPLTEGDDDAI